MKEFLFKVNRVYKKVNQKDIIYFQVDGKYVDIYIKNRKYSIRSSIKNILPLLGTGFIRIHASFVLNTSFIVSINTENKVVLLENNKEIPYSRGFKENLLNSFIVY